ncbi:hypothetical protein EYF80_007682 [Liparis tanakae]|uniref:Uncharacterized protein n=1 Tax=Liparis tanakae TaxID=230148 RepID=A0A4Z2IVW8_9TELE|nr:hypothetical protein EYF80_007682 [Liparis tanakae]
MPSPDVAKQRINYCSLLKEERWSQKSTSPHRDMKRVCKRNAETPRDFLGTDDVTGVGGKGSEKKIHTAVREREGSVSACHAVSLRCLRMTLKLDEPQGPVSVNREEMITNVLLHHNE